MNENIKLTKFIMKIKDIDEKLNQKTINSDVFLSINTFMPEKFNLYQLIIDRTKCNKYSMVIIGNATLNLNDWNQYIRGKEINDTQTKLNAIKELISILRNSYNREEAIKLIYWLLLIVAVDDNQYNERVSMISNLSVMLGIKDNTIRDLVKLVKFTLDENIYESMFETQEVINIFRKLSNKNINNTNYDNGNSKKGLKDLFR